MDISIGAFNTWVRASESLLVAGLTLGFSGAPIHDEGSLLPAAFMLKKLTPSEQARNAALVKKMVSFLAV